jgi:arylsulfatase A-like enzyme
VTGVRVPAVLAVVLALLCCDREPPASVTLLELSSIAAFAPDPTASDFTPAKSWGEHATAGGGTVMALIRPDGRVRMTGHSLFPLVIELSAEPLRPTGLELRWAGQYLHTMTVPRSSITHQIMIPPRQLESPSRGLSLRCSGEPARTAESESTYVLFSNVRAVWGPPRGETDPSEPVELSVGEQLCVFLPAAERQWLSMAVGAADPSARVLATVTSESGERALGARLKCLGSAKETWLGWSWPQGVTGRQRLSLRAEGNDISVRLRRVGWSTPQEYPVCAIYKLPLANDPRPPIVVILLDALRADRWGAERNGQSLTPALDHIAERGVLFRHGRCQVPYTRGSLPCIMTGRYPSAPRDVSDHGSPATLAGLLRGHGYATVAVTANGYLQPGTPPAEGFDLSFYVHTWLRAHWSADPPYWGEHLLAPVRELLFQLGDQPFLLFIHLMEPHAPYAPPAPFDMAWAPREAGRLAGLEPFGPRMVPGAVRWAPTPEETAYLRGRYEGNVAYGDHVVAALLQALEQHGPEQEPVILVVSDHGEALLEHNSLGHGASLYEENLQVPICLCGNGLPRGRVIDSPVELVDVAPTVLELVGCPATEAMDGRSLLSVIADGRQAKPGPFVAACTQEDGDIAGRVACYAPPWKYIHLGGPEEQLYNLQDDPGETVNVAGAHPETCDSMRRLCAAWAHREIEAIAPPAESLTDEERGRLEELGYLVR